MGESVLSADHITTTEASNRYSHALRYIMMVVCILISLYSVVNFTSNALSVYNNVTPLRNGLDYLYFYSGGVVWDRGLNEYDPDAFLTTMQQINPDKAYWLQPIYYYLPPTSVLYGLLAKVDYPTAFNIYWIINVSMTVVSVVLMGVILSWFRRVGLLEIAFLTLLLNSPYGRASIEIGQLGAPIFVVILAAFILYRNKRYFQGIVLTTLLIVKFSFLPLYAGYYLLRRHYRAFVLCVVLSAVLVILPLILTQRPLVERFNGWFDMMSISQEYGTANSPSPFEIHSTEHIDLRPLLYRVLNAHSRVSSLISWVVIGAVVAYSAYLIFRTKVVTLKSQLLDFALVSMLTLISIYHRNYDVFLIFPALLYVYIHTRDQSSSAARRNWAIFTVVMVLVLTIPHSIARQLLIQDPSLIESYVWRVVAPYQAWCNILLLGVILWLKRQQVVQEKQSVPVTVENAATA
jgi:hypothetical protein